MCIGGESEDTLEKILNIKTKISQVDRQLQYMQLLFEDKGTDEYITVFGTDKADSSKSTTKHFKGITTAINYINKIRGHYNVYVNLATTDGQGRATENLISRNVIALDFDLKDLGAEFNYKDLIHIFKQNGLYYHLLINSGNGFHVYLKTERTQDISKLTEINKAICQRVGADINACKVTQVLRVPSTYNYKNGLKKQVRCIFLADKIKDYAIDRLYSQFVYSTKIEETNLKYVATKNMPPCIIEILKGVAEGERDFCLGRLTKYFQLQNNSYNQALAIIKEWNNRNTPPISDNSLEYHFKKYWEGNYLLMGCKSDDECIQAILSKYCDKLECNKIDKYQAVYSHEIKTVDIEYSTMEKCKPRYDKRGGKIMLDGNHIAIISILKVKEHGLNYKQIEQELTSRITKKVRMSKPTILKVLDELSDMGVIDKVVGNRKTIPTLYKIKDLKCLDTERVTISYQATQGFIDGAVGQSAFRLYCYMMYRLRREQNVVQEEIGRDLGLTQKAISKSMLELEQARYINTIKDYRVNPLGANRVEWLA